MKKVKLLLVCGAFALMMASCSTKQRAINQLESFSYELRDNSRYYDLQDWEKAGKKFVKITNLTTRQPRKPASADSKVSVPATWPVVRRTM